MVFVFYTKKFCVLCAKQQWELEFDAVNENLPEIIERYGSDGRKIYADVYIDDKSCFPWEVKKDEKVGL